MKKFNQRKINNWLLVENLKWNNPLVAFTILGPISIPGFLYNAYQITKNHTILTNERAKCLIFDEPITEWQSVMLGVKGSLARFFTQKKVRVEYQHNAHSQDLKRALEDLKYQNIAVVGHGGRDNWCARDGIVYREDVDEWMQGLPKKTGYFIQHTCGSPSGRALGENVVEDRRKILGYKKKVHLGDRFDRLWFDDSADGINSLENIGD